VADRRSDRGERPGVVAVNATTPWTDGAIPPVIPGRHVHDRWGRQYIADTDLGLCCCVTCHDLRTAPPIGSREASGWDGSELDECPTCRWQEADEHVAPVRGAVVSPNQQAAGYFLQRRWQELVRFTDTNPSLAGRYRW